MSTTVAKVLVHDRLLVPLLFLPRSAKVQAARPARATTVVCHASAQSRREVRVAERARATSCWKAAAPLCAILLWPGGSTNMLNSEIHSYD
jgi:hypothetical protein